MNYHGNPYDITPEFNNPLEPKMNRDQIKFPNALPANSHKPFHTMDHTFIDRQFQNDRRQRDQLPVQNQYMQQYQIHQLQQMSMGNGIMEQNQVDRIMDKKAPTDGNLLNSNRDDSKMFNRQNQYEVPNFMAVPVDTRKEKFDLNNDRAPIPKTLGAPPKFQQYRNI